MTICPISSQVISLPTAILLTLDMKGEEETERIQGKRDDRGRVIRRESRHSGGNAERSKERLRENSEREVEGENARMEAQ